MFWQHSDLMTKAHLHHTVVKIVSPNKISPYSHSWFIEPSNFSFFQETNVMLAGLSKRIERQRVAGGQSDVWPSLIWCLLHCTVHWPLLGPPWHAPPCCTIAFLCTAAPDHFLASSLIWKHCTAHYMAALPSTVASRYGSTVASILFCMLMRPTH